MKLNIKRCVPISLFLKKKIYPLNSQFTASTVDEEIHLHISGL